MTTARRTGTRDGAAGRWKKTCQLALQRKAVGKRTTDLFASLFLVVHTALLTGLLRPSGRVLSPAMAHETDDPLGERRVLAGRVVLPRRQIDRFQRPDAVGVERALDLEWAGDGQEGGDRVHLAVRREARDGQIRLEREAEGGQRAGDVPKDAEPDRGDGVVCPRQVDTAQDDLQCREAETVREEGGSESVEDL